MFGTVMPYLLVGPEEREGGAAGGETEGAGD